MTMSQTPSGYREIAHTADWEMEVWAPDFSSLLEQSAIGMYALSGTILAPEPEKQYKFTLDYFDRESLLVEFLSELLFYSESENVGFKGFELKLRDKSLDVVATGAPLYKLVKEIKAVTYHNLEIRETEQGLQTKIVFDV